MAKVVVGLLGISVTYAVILLIPIAIYKLSAKSKVFSSSNDKEIEVNAGAWKVLAIPTAHWCIWNEQYKWFI